MKLFIAKPEAIPNPAGLARKRPRGFGVGISPFSSTFIISLLGASSPLPLAAASSETEIALQLTPAIGQHTLPRLLADSSSQGLLLLQLSQDVLLPENSHPGPSSGEASSPPLENTAAAENSTESLRIAKRLESLTRQSRSVALIPAENVGHDMFWAAAQDEDDELDLPAPPSPRVALPSSAAASQSQTKPPTKPPARATKMRIAPITWSGSTSSNFGYSRTSGDPAMLSQNLIATLNANSYIWQPWFARSNAFASLNRSSSSSGGVSSPASVSLSLGGNLMLLPVSRFPANLGYNYSTSGGGASTSVHSLTYQQSYQPEGDAYNLNGFGNYTSVFSSGTNTMTAFQIGSQFGMSLPGEYPQNISATASWGHNRSYQGFGADTLNTSASHNINLEDYVMTINSTAGMVHNSVIQQDGKSQSLVMNATSQGTWIPSDDYPLTLNGNASYFFTHTAANGGNAGTGSNQSHTMYAFVTGHYPINEKWTSNGNVMFNTFIPAAGTASSNLNASLSVGWGDSLYQINRKIAGFDYNLNLGAGGGGSVSANVGTGTTGGGLGLGGGLSFSQMLYRIIELSPGRVANLSINQAASTNYSLGTGVKSLTPQLSLSHGGSLSWPLLQSPLLQAHASLTAGDSRTLGGAISSYQQNLAGNLTASMFTGPYSSLIGYLQGGLSKQGLVGIELPEGVNQPSWQPTLSGSAQYQHRRFAGVPGLFYSANYSLAAYQDQGGSLSQFGHGFGQGLSWSLGRLSMNLNNSFSVSSYGRSASLFFTLTRSMGGVI